MAPKSTKQAKAGLEFPVSRTRHALRTRTGRRVGSAAAVYLTAAGEFVITHAVRATAARATQSKRYKGQAMPRHLQLAAGRDRDLCHILKFNQLQHPDVDDLPAAESGGQ